MCLFEYILEKMEHLTFLLLYIFNVFICVAMTLGMLKLYLDNTASVWFQSSSLYVRR